MARLKNITITNTITERTPVIMKYFEDIKKYPLLTVEEEVELGYKIRTTKDKDALDKLVRSNLRFAISIAKQYTGKLPFSDLINVSNMGLIKAAERFDETKGFKFISYAVWWIRQAILKAISNTNVIKLPSNVLMKLNKINHFRHVFYQENKRIPTYEEIKDATGFNNIELFEKSIHIKSYNMKIGFDNDMELVEILESQDNNVEYTLNKSDLIININAILNKLPQRERLLIQHLYGLNGFDILTKEELSIKFKLSSERIRQLESLILKKFKKYKHLFFN